MEKKKNFQMSLPSRHLIKALNQEQHNFNAELNVSVTDIAQALARANLTSEQLNQVCEQIKQETMNLQLSNTPKNQDTRTIF